MLNEKLQSYLEELIPMRDELLFEMETYAKQNAVPIMELAAIETMLQILRIHQPKKLLEIGTAIGYSALRMAYTLPDSFIVTAEKDPERLKLAWEFLSRSGRAGQIQLLYGDALELREEIEKHAPYDFIFIDAAKGQYRKFFEMYSPYLAENGIVLTDNVLFRGLVCEKDIQNRNKRGLVRKINDFNKWLMEHEGFDTVILPVGDGVAISRKR